MDSFPTQKHANASDIDGLVQERRNSIGNALAFTSYLY